MVAIQKGSVGGESKVTGPRGTLIIPQDMFEVESCLRDSVELLPGRSLLLLELGWSKAKWQWWGRIFISPANGHSMGKFRVMRAQGSRRSMARAVSRA